LSRNYPVRGNAQPHPGPLLPREGENNPIAESVHRFVIKEHVVKISLSLFGKRERAGVRVFIPVNNYGFILFPGRLKPEFQHCLG